VTAYAELLAQKNSNDSATFDTNLIAVQEEYVELLVSVI